MQFPEPLVPGILLGREKRFLVHVRLESGEQVIAHTNNTGSMRGCSEPGSRVWLSPATGPRRRLAWTHELVEAGDPPVLVGINTQHANELAREAIAAGVVPELSGHEWIRREVAMGAGTRCDLLLGDGPREAPRARTWVEVKNVTLVEDRVARFPDAVTARGRRHLAALSGRVAQGERAAMLFVVQRQDAMAMGPADAIDPAYGAALRQARDDGVEVLACRAAVATTGIAIDTRLPVQL
ncbi:DNA/RNA nuclease SfsA [bacterium]|nr:DNA/RNA nuclease SfsA [bacterium]